MSNPVEPDFLYCYRWESTCTSFSIPGVCKYPSILIFCVGRFCLHIKSAIKTFNFELITFIPQKIHNIFFIKLAQIQKASPKICMISWCSRHVKFILVFVCSVSGVDFILTTIHRWINLIDIITSDVFQSLIGIMVLSEQD